MEASRCDQSGKEGSLRKDRVPCRRREEVSCLEVPSAAPRTCCYLLGEDPEAPPRMWGENGRVSPLHPMALAVQPLGGGLAEAAQVGPGALLSPGGPRLGGQRGDVSGAGYSRWDWPLGLVSRRPFTSMPVALPGAQAVFLI